MADTYKAKAACNNCKQESEHEVPKGSTIVEFLSKMECPHCGCKTLTKSESQFEVEW